MLIINFSDDRVWDCAANLWRKTAWDRFMRTDSNSPLTQKYGDKTTHVSITVLFVLKLIGSPVLTQLRTGQKEMSVNIPIAKNPPWTAGPHAIAWVAWCLNTLLDTGRFRYMQGRRSWIWMPILCELLETNKDCEKMKKCIENFYLIIDWLWHYTYIVNY